MRISDLSSDVCSSDLSARSTGGSGSLRRNVVDRVELILLAPILAAIHARSFVRLSRHASQKNTGPGYRFGGGAQCRLPPAKLPRSEEHTSELQSLMRISYAVFCLKKKKKQNQSD